MLLRLDVNNAPYTYFPPDIPALQVDRRLRADFPGDQVFVLFFEGVALYSEGFLQAFDALARNLAEDSRITRVLTVTRQDHIAPTEDGFEVAPLLDVEALAGTTPADRRRRVLADRFARDALVAHDGEGLAMIVIPTELENSLQRRALQRDILAQVRRYRLQGYLTALAGQVPLDVAELESMLHDNMVFIPATTLTGLVLVWWLFRRVLAVLTAGLVTGAVVASTVAVYVLTGQPFTLVSSIVPPLLAALTLATIIHVFNALHDASRIGLFGPARMRRALQAVQRPVLYTSLTTAAGLASLAASRVRPVAVFGLISAVGVLLVYALLRWVLPAFLGRLDRRPWHRERGGLRHLDRFVRRISRLGIRHAGAVLVVTGLALAAATPALWKITTETSFLEFFRPDHPIRRDTDRIERRLAGLTSLEVLFTAPDEGGLRRPGRLREIRDFQRWAEAQPEIDRTLSAADFVEEMNWAFHGGRDAARRIPDDPKLVSQYLFVYDGDDLYDLVDEGFTRGRVTLNLNVHRANRISAVMERIRARLAGIGDLHWEIGGFGRLFADMEDLLVQGQFHSLLGALVLVFVLMALLWRSVGEAALCMLPNLSPVLLIFILMGLAGIWLDMATVMIASVAVGIAVDDTIHLYHGYRSRRRRGASPVVALARTYRHAGRAVTTTTLILCAQFFLMTASRFVPTAHFGLLTGVGLLAALVFDLLVLPALLMALHGRRGRRRATSAG
ncbi:MAG: RND transporter [Gammaproteobacteria bacterium]|nr:MAG: RND transporter [Gammaproteobacteria bacterium]